MLKDPHTYEHVLPESVGNHRKVLVSDQAGRSNVIAELDRAGIAYEKSDPKLARLVEELKEREAAGYAYEFQCPDRLFGCPPMLHAWQSRGWILRASVSSIWLDELARNTRTPLTSARVGDAILSGRRTARMWPMPRTVQAAPVSIKRRRTARVASNCCSNRAAAEISTTGRGTAVFCCTSEVDSKTRSDLWLMPLAGDRKPTVYLNSEFNETHGQFSPDGHWIAYASDESGLPQIYVRPFPLTADSEKSTVSSGGGVMPRWRRDGKELFFLAAKARTVMVANVSYTPTFTTSVPVPAFTGSIQHTAATSAGRPDSFNWDITADGQKVLLPTVATQEHPPQPPIIVVLNWTALLKK